MRASQRIAMISAIGLFSASLSFANNIRTDVEKNIFGCYDTVVFNNSNATVRGGRIDWRYDYGDGSYNQGSTNFGQIGPGQRANISTFDSFDLGKCKTVRYNFKVLNWRTF
jgi:hypothetical protein